ncbi:MAG TPA: class I SAM-dependent methyltransferase [Janthinobacterium sp.]|jgi:SAM-dependent methyltransferase|nr:class I SAM-dependent methyltransferase [Janthinobacterium sp.]
MNQAIRCPVCGGSCALLDVVDLNKSCEEANGVFLPLAGVPVYYALCGGCGFCHAPQLWQWSMREFEEKIYNADYVLADPHYAEARPRASAADLIAMFGAAAKGIRHLDYGGGHGMLSRLLNEAGWSSTSYDPFVNKELDLKSVGRFDLITAYEVFEHVPDVDRLMAELVSLLAPGGMVLFSTMLSDGHIQPRQRLSWWYAAPRNGHISLFSRASLELLARKAGLNLGSFSDVFHLLYSGVPAWAEHIFAPGQG